MPKREQNEKKNEKPKKDSLASGESKPESIKRDKQEKAQEILDRFARNRKYKPEYAQQLLEHVKSGRSYISFAAECGVSVSTLYEWRDKHPEFKEAWQIAQPLAFKHWENQGMMGLWLDKDMMFNTTNYIFQMTNRFRSLGWKRGDTEEKQAQGSRPINVISEMDIERMVSGGDDVSL